MAILVKYNVIFNLLIFAGIGVFLTLDSDRKSFENIHSMFENLFPNQTSGDRNILKTEKYNRSSHSEVFHRIANLKNYLKVMDKHL